MKWQVLTLLVIAIGSYPAIADVYKCTTPDGKTSISDQPCTKSKTQSVRKDEFVTQDQYSQAQRNVQAMRNENMRRDRENCVSNAQLNAGLTKSKREDAIAACLGLPKPRDDYEAQPTHAPAYIQSCNQGVCWDGQGNRYSESGGQMRGPNGKSCVRKGSALYCD